MPKTGNPWTTLRVKPVYDNPWIKVDEHDVLNPKGGPGIYGLVHFKNVAIGVVPIDREGFTYLVGQYRYALGRYSWEIPEGGGKPDVAPQVSAARELVEETGLHARQWREILHADLSNSVSDEVAFGFIAWELEQGEATPEETEELQVRRVPFAEAFGMVMRGDIRDSLSQLCLMRVRLLAQQGELPGDLARLILC